MNCLKPVLQKEDKYMATEKQRAIAFIHRTLKVSNPRKLQNPQIVAVVNWLNMRIADDCLTALNKLAEIEIPLPNNDDIP